MDSLLTLLCGSTGAAHSSYLSMLFRLSCFSLIAKTWPLAACSKSRVAH